MSILLVTYDLRQPGRNYQPVYDYLRQFVHCKGMESVWLLDTATEATKVRDGLMKVVDRNDAVLVVKLGGPWAAYGYSCGDWLKEPTRNW